MITRRFWCRGRRGLLTPWDEGFVTDGLVVRPRLSARVVLFFGAHCRLWEDWVTEWESLLSSSAASPEKRLRVLISCQVLVMLEAEEQELSLIVWISFWSSLFCWVSWSAFTFYFPFSDFKLSLSDFNCRNSALVFTCSAWSSFTHFVSCCICARKSFMVRSRIRHRSHAQTPT